MASFYDSLVLDRIASLEQSLAEEKKKNRSLSIECNSLKKKFVRSKEKNLQLKNRLRTEIKKRISVP